MQCDMLTYILLQFTTFPRQHMVRISANMTSQPCCIGDQHYEQGLKHGKIKHMSSCYKSFLSIKQCVLYFADTC